MRKHPNEDRRVRFKILLVSKKHQDNQIVHFQILRIAADLTIVMAKLSFRIWHGILATACMLTNIVLHCYRNPSFINRILRRPNPLFGTTVPLGIRLSMTTTTLTSWTFILWIEMPVKRTCDVMLCYFCLLFWTAKHNSCREQESYYQW